MTTMPSLIPRHGHHRVVERLRELHGAVVAARDPHGSYRPASLIKTLLATVALDTLDAERSPMRSADPIRP